jgi:gliding motility-associated-like protein
LPLYDIEYNDIGFLVKQIRPAGGQLKIYWDDLSIGGISNTSAGCTNATGCHTWNYGNDNTINSWWFVTGSEFVNSSFVSKKSPARPVVSGKNVHCTGTSGSLEFTLANDPNSTSTFWSYSGTGVTITETETKATLNFTANSTAGTLSVYGHNEGCGNGPESSLEIIFEAPPVVVLPLFPDLCYTAPAFSLTGGEPQGGTYFVHGIEADSIYPYQEPEGWLPIEYLYSTPAGCLNSDTSGILLTSGADCLGTIYFPNAFTPDGDSLNDQFRAVVRNISSFKMYVFNRWGELIYSTDDAAKGWDGTSEGKACPEGTYTFTATYGMSRRTDNIETKRGVFGLIR